MRAAILFLIVLTARADDQTPGREWVTAAETARRDFSSAHGQFRKLLETTTDEKAIALLVEVYVREQRPRELLRIAEDLFRETDAKKLTADETARRHLFSAALLKHRGFAVPLLRSARGKSYPDHLWDLLVGFGDVSGTGEETEALLRAGHVPGDGKFEAFDRLVNFYERHRQWEKIITLCDTIGEFEAYRAILLSEAYAELGRGEEALALLSKQKLAEYTVRRRSAHVLSVLGKHREMLAMLDAMLKDYQAFEEVRGIRLLRAEAFRCLGRFKEMDAEYEALLEENPDDALVLNNYGYNLADQNRRLLEAEALVRHAITMDRKVRAGEPFLERATYLDSLGWALFRRGQWKESREQLEKAVALPDGCLDAVVWDHLGDVRFAQGDRPGARQAWRKAGDCFENDSRGREQSRAATVEKKLRALNESWWPLR